MRSQKLLIVSATMLACTSLATASFADDTTTQGHSGSSSATSQSGVTPSASSTSSTSTTLPSQGSSSGVTATTPSSSATIPSSSATIPSSSATTPTSTTTTTSADDATAASSTPPPSLATPTTGESQTVYAKRTPNKALLITGASLFAGTYVTTAALAGANGGIGDKDLYLPIVGPWINIAERTPGTRENNTRDTLLIAGSGVLQGVGAVMAVTSFFVPEKIPAARIQAGNVKMEISPQAGAGMGGVGAFGTF